VELISVGFIYKHEDFRAVSYHGRMKNIAYNMTDRILISQLVLLKNFP
jgi:hypothetical protein